jgi:hypothetical protein
MDFSLCPIFEFSFCYVYYTSWFLRKWAIKKNVVFSYLVLINYKPCWFKVWSGWLIGHKIEAFMTKIHLKDTTQACVTLFPFPTVSRKWRQHSSFLFDYSIIDRMRGVGDIRADLVLCWWNHSDCVMCHFSLLPYQGVSAVPKPALVIALVACGKVTSMSVPKWLLTGSCQRFPPKKESREGLMHGYVCYFKVKIHRFFFVTFARQDINTNVSILYFQMKIITSPCFASRMISYIDSFSFLGVRTLKLPLLDHWFGCIDRAF